MNYYVSSGGTSNGIILSDFLNDYMYVFSGGTANSTTISDGNMYVSRGGTANSTTISGGDMYISSGGTANNTTISGGYLYVYGGGTATNIAWTPCVGSFWIEDGAYVTFISQYSGVYYYGSGNQLLSHAALLESETVSGYNASMYIMSGGTANNTIFEGGGSMYVMSGGTVNNTKVSSGYMHVSSGGTANSTTVSGGFMNVYGGGTANSTTVNGGDMYVESGGTANNTTVKDGYLYVSSGGTATNIAWTPCEGEVQIKNGAYATFVSQYSGVYYGSNNQLLSHAAVMESKTVYDVMYVMSGGTANNTIFEGGGSMYVMSGGTANNTTVNRGYMYVSSGGTANSTTVNSGYMYVSSGGTANNTTVSGSIVTDYYVGYGYVGAMDISSGGTANNTTIESGYLYVSSGGMANNTTVISGGSLYVSSGGTATNINWTPCVGTVWISDGAYVTFVSQYSGVYYGSGDQLISHTSEMSDMITDNSALLYVMDGGTANSMTISGNGDFNRTYMYISSGGAANYTTLVNGGYMYISSGGTANSTTISGGYMYISSGGAANYTTLVNGGGMYVFSGGEANHTTVNSGYMYVSSGGTANSTTISDGNMYVYGGGAANYTTLVYGGGMCVESGGTANNTTVKDGYLHVSSGGTATNIEWTPCVGTVWIENGAYATFVSQYSGVYYGSNNQLLSHAAVMESKTVYDVMYVMSGGTANNTMIDSGFMYVNSGGTANNTTVSGFKYNGGYTCGAIYISSGGTANNTTVISGGFMYVYGGTANNIIARDQCTIYLGENGGKFTGHMTFESGASVCTENSGGAHAVGTVDFDLRQTSAGAAALVNDLSAFHGSFVYTLTVDGTQQSGDYDLAEGAAEFNGTISVVNDSGTSLGELTVGQTLKTQYADYTLNLNGNTLSVAIERISFDVETSFFTGAFDGGDKSLLAREYEDMAAIWKDGASWKLNQDLKLGTFAGTGDFNGDGRTDVLRLHYTGLVIGEMSNGDGTFDGTLLNKLGAGWSIAGIGDFNGNGTDDVLVMNPVGASETTGLVGYWEGGRTWNIINGYTAEWELVATGDFNGDGKCDMLWRNSFEGDGGQIFNAYCTWIVDPPTGETDWRMVSVAAPDEWVFLCAGDFDGDKTCDIAMINDAGVVGIWGISDGWLSSWSILSAVNTAEWSLIGVDDFSGDGTDDIAWYNADAGIAGFWQIENKELSAWQNLATLL